MKRRSDTEKPRLFLYDVLFRVAGMLFLLVMLSVWLICGMFAKYVVTDKATDSARVASFLTVEVLEHKAELKNGQYQLTSDEVKENAYQKVIPGVDIPKDPFVRMTGTPEVSCMLYLKVTEEDFPTCNVKIPTITFELTDEWAEYQDGYWSYKGSQFLPHVFSSDETTVTYELTDDWTLVQEIEQDRYLYQYFDLTIDVPGTIGSVVQEKQAITYDLTTDWNYLEALSDPGNGIYFYKYKSTLPPGTTAMEIPILRQIGDNHCELKVSEHYVGEFDTKGNPLPFSLTFTVWLVQAD